MRKYLIALTVALMVCLLGVSASAETEEDKAISAAMEEQANISIEIIKTIEANYPDGADVKTQLRIIKETYEKAGWTVVQKAPAKARTEGIAPRVMELAYSNIDGADAKTKKEILDAREKVIFNNGWFNDTKGDALSSYSVNPAAKTIEFLPAFSELFPGWELPVPNKKDVAQFESIDSVIQGYEMVAARNTITIFSERMTITRANGVSNNFFTAGITKGVNNILQLGASESYTSGLNTVNVGYQDFPSGEYGPFLPRMSIASYLPYTVTINDTKTVSRVGTRMSTYDGRGDVRAVVKRTIQP